MVLVDNDADPSSAQSAIKESKGPRSDRHRDRGGSVFDGDPDLLDIEQSIEINQPCSTFAQSDRSRDLLERDTLCVIIVMCCTGLVLVV